MKITVPLALFALCATVVADTVYLNGVIRDQGPNTMWNCGGNPGSANGTAGFFGTDFQLPGSAYSNDERGLVGPECNAATGWYPPACAALGADNTPTYIFPGKSPLGNVQSPASFYTWFHDSNHTQNVAVSVPLTQSGSTYIYKNDSFFPLDGIGWGDSCHDQNNILRNFGFCFEAHTRFGYTGSEVFSFTGDDDLWIFIDGRLVIDLGSLHPKESRTLALNTIAGLTAGSSYRMDMFYCERHTQYSELELDTSLIFYCAYTDWCGVCEGNGQSCCTAAVIAQYCNDNNACTTDGCAAQTAPSAGGCTHTAITCPASTSQCQISSCDTTQGCIMTAVNCDDGNACTVDTCSATSGCVHTPVVCNDNSVCTTDACVAGKCVFTDISASCNDSNLCTTDSCNAVSGCQHLTITCNDNNACTTDTCGASTGCVYTNITSSCNDNSLCTVDSCLPASGCSYAQISCVAEDKCHTAACSATKGCVQTNISASCTDNNPCTTDACSPTAGCTYTPVNCDDGNSCTTDSCDSTGKCQHVTTDASCSVCGTTTCNTTNPCYPAYCVNKATSTCGNTSVVCNDNNACTADSCGKSASNSAISQCTFTPINCTQTDVCSPMVCDTVLGCQAQPVVCNDNNNCTIDTCANHNGAATCVFTPVNCTTVDPCSPLSCSASTGQCIATPVNCDDGNACTTDVCLAIGGVAQCNHTAKSCGTPCNPSVCNTTTGNCDLTPRVCNDYNPCTTDTPICIINATTTGTPACNFTLTPDVCDDGSVCTNDFCNSSASSNATMCYHTQIPCVGTVCQNYTSCNAVNGCQFEALVCPSVGDYCLQGQCDVTALGCITIPRICPNKDVGCYVASCNSNQSACILTERPGFSSLKSSLNVGVLCPIVWDPAVQKATISAGVIAGATVGAAAGAALLGLGGKKGYDYLQARSGAMGNVASNPLYAPSAAGGSNALYN